MCGIAGYFAPNQPAGAEVLRQMVRSLAHRGPDAEGFYTDHLAGLGHRRLSIIDVSAAANQPMTSRDSRWIMVYNGEVYNFREIAKELATTLRTHSDTEVILEAFAKWGPSAVSRFNGMFAIALYDVEEKGLYLFRDRIGVKPLYYVTFGNKFFFASELKAITCLQEIARELQPDQEAIALYLQLGYIPQPYTIWQQVKKFPSGSYMKITADGQQIIRWWKPEEAIHPAVISDVKSAKDQLLQLLSSAVSYRMISDVPFGTFLSGGVDSSLIAALAQRNSATKINTFTIGFHEKQFNEATHAKQIAQHLHTDHHELMVTQEEAMELLETFIDTYDEPFADSSGFPTLLISRWASRQVKMVLTGDGGDELFMGYGMYRWPQWLQNPLVRMGRIPIGAALQALGGKYARIAWMFRYSNTELMKQHIFSQAPYFFTDTEIESLLMHPASVPVLPSFATTAGRHMTPAEEQSFFDIEYYLKDDLLVKVDRASMKYGLECRTPFLDYRVVEFALNVSPKMKMNRSRLKILPSLVLKELLPPELFQRPKRGFSIPLLQWMQHEWHHLLDDYLSEEIISRHGVVRYATVSSLKKKFLAGEHYLYNRLWNLVVLHRWFEQHIRK